MYLNLIWPALQLIEKGLASGKGFSGGSEYVGLAGVAHAYLHLSSSMAQISASQMASAPEPLQALAASHDSLLSMAAQIVKAASASPRVSESQCTLPHAVFSVSSGRRIPLAGRCFNGGETVQQHHCTCLKQGQHHA